MKYEKPPLSFEAQAYQPLGRGLEADRAELIERLQAVNYYRLSGYLYPFRDLPSHCFLPNTTLEKVWRRYVFDRQLRVLVMDVIERIEISVKTQIAYQMAMHYRDPFAYTDTHNLSKLNAYDFGVLLSKTRLDNLRSHEHFVGHFRRQYGDCHSHLPIWMAVEVMTFGTMLTLYRGIDSAIKRAIVADYGVPFQVFESWLLCINVIRNICAHYGRLWNRVLGVKPKILHARKYPDWHNPVCVGNEKMFCVLTILRYLLKRIAPQSKWRNRLQNLLASYPDIPLRQMGFAENWRECPIWR